MQDDDPASVDISVAFFACVVVLFAFVVFAVARPVPAEDVPTTGQSLPSVDAVPPTWQPVPERTTFALLVPDRLHVLELDHFAKGFFEFERQVNVDQHYESHSLLERDAAVGAFVLRINTTMRDLPPEWVRATFPLAKFEDPPPTGPDETAEACPANRMERSPFYRSLVTVFVASDAGASLSAFLRLAAACSLRYRLLPVAQRQPGKLVTIAVGLTARQFSLNAMFR